MISQTHSGTWLEDQSGPAINVQLGIPGDEGLLAAFVPDLDSLSENDYDDEVVDIPADSGVGVLYRGTVVDIVGPAPVRWWKVKNLARLHALDIIEPFWHGPAAEFRVECVPPRKPEGYTVAVRGYRRGPWIDLATRPVKA